MIDLINVTPHTLTIRTDDGDIVLEPSGTVARVETSTSSTDSINGIPVVRTIFGTVTGIPDYKDNTVYIASSLVVSHTKRADVFAPDTGKSAIRENGQIVAVTGLQKF